MNGPLIQAIAEHVEVTAHAGHECTPEHLAAALQPLLDAEVERRVDAKVRLCARCGVREVVHIPGRMNCCDTCAVEVSNEVWAERVDAEVERRVDAENEALRATLQRVGALADEYDLSGSPRLIAIETIVTELRAALGGADTGEVGA